MRLKRELQHRILPFRRRLSPAQFILFCALLVGMISGLAALFLKWYVFQVQQLVFRLAGDSPSGVVRFLLPVLGLWFCAWVIRRFFSRSFQRGADKIVLAIARRKSFLPPSQMYSHLLTSGITIGFGGSTGVESPLVSTGAAIGANVASFFNLSYRDRTLLLGCGISAVISAAFNAPIAGVLFTLEVILTNSSISRMMPLILSAAAGGVFSRYFLGNEILLTFPGISGFAVRNLPFYLLLGLSTGWVSRWYAVVSRQTEKRFEASKSRWWVKSVVAGLVLGALTLVLPPLYGEGYEMMKKLVSAHPERIMQGSVFSSFLRQEAIFPVATLLCLLLKAFATSFTLNGGGVGGNFAPSLFMGGLCGFLLSLLSAILGFTVPTTHFVLAGMAGCLSGVFYAPLTAIFLIAEITGGYELMIPLMLVSSVSYFTVRSNHPLSMEMRKLARADKILTHDQDTFLGSLLKTEELMDQDFLVVPAGTLLENALLLLRKHSVREIFLTDSQGQLLGYIETSELYERALQHQEGDESISLLQLGYTQAREREGNISGKEALDFLERYGLEFIVITRHGKPLGVLRQERLLQEYRKLVRDV